MKFSRKVATWTALLILLLIFNGRTMAADAKDSQLINITLKDRAQVTGATYKLGDLAKIESGDRVIVQELSNLEIGKSPRVGYLDRVNWKTLRSYIERANPGFYDRIQFHGAKIVAVETVGTIVDASTYVDPAREALGDWLGSHYKDYDIKLKGQYRNLQLPHGKVAVETKLGDVVKASSSMHVWADILVDGNHHQTMSVGFDVKAFGPVWVAGKSMKKGNVITKGLLRRDYRDITRLSNAPVTENQLTDTRLKQSIGEGDVVTQSDIEAIPDVSKGEEVAVTAKSGAVVVTATAVALDDGNVGDSIRVEKPNTNIVYQVKVTGRKQATINGD